MIDILLKDNWDKIRDAVEGSLRVWRESGMG